MLRTTFTAALVLALASFPAFAQEQDAEKVKKEILDKVRERIREEHKKIIERLSKIIDEELGKSTAQTPDPKPDRPDPKPADPKSEPAKKIRELQKKLAALEDQRDDILKEIRAVKRDEEDKPIKDDLRKNPFEDAQEASETFKEFYDLHAQATEQLKKDREAAVRDFRKCIAGFKKVYYAMPKDRGLGVPAAYNVACGYALIGEKDQALDWIEIAIASGYNTPDDFNHMRKDTDLDSLRKERRYQRIMLDK